jgi:hypothetical protein
MTERHSQRETPTPTPQHTPEEMDALLQAAVDGLVSARAAIDACLNERLQWASDNTEAYNDAAGAAHLDARKAQDAMVRIVDLVLLTFHPDRVAVLSYGPQLAEVVETMKFDNEAMQAALARHRPTRPAPHDDDDRP